jgi:uncharacterized damage-inducible protein DinB
MKLLTHLKSFPEDIFRTQTSSVFQTISATFYHIYNAERIWLKRCIPNVEVNETITDFKDIEYAKANFLELNSLLMDALQHGYNNLGDIVHQNLRGVTFTNNINDIILHLVNHGTYHRGNIASMVREFGYKGTSTDYIQYVREQEKSI